MSNYQHITNCIQVSGRNFNGKFRVTGMQQLMESSGYDDWNTITNILRIKMSESRGRKGFPYAFPLVFGR